VTDWRFSSGRTSTKASLDASSTATWPRAPCDIHPPLPFAELWAAIGDGGSRVDLQSTPVVRKNHIAREPAFGSPHLAASVCIIIIKTTSTRVRARRHTSAAAMLKIMFLNIFEGCRDDDRLGLIADYVQHREPDVLGLSELCGWRDRGRARMRHFAGLTGLRHWVVCESRSTFDVGLLAKRPLGPRITLREGVSNGLLVAEVPLQSAEPLAVMVLHLSPGDEDTRRRELDTVARHAWGRDRLVVMGDMNALSPSDLTEYRQTDLFSRVRAAGHAKYGTEHLRTDAMASLLGFGLVDAVRVMRGDGLFVPSVPTPFSTDSHHNVAEVRVDYILVSADLAQRVIDARVDASKDTDRLSDHRPVLATLDLMPASV
jgi:exodeoxyribonuclease III